MLSTTGTAAGHSVLEIGCSTGQLPEAATFERVAMSGRMGPFNALRWRKRV
jgi:cyclopropane fatty-acyl-phospholipid synthase-like methyltransferase